MVLWLATIAFMVWLSIVVEAAILGDLFTWRTWRAMTRLFAGRRPEPAAPPHRPIEAIAADLRRIGAAFHLEGMRFAKYEGCRQAYDRVLGEACDAVEVPHLMGVLPPGDRLDFERDRVERLLTVAGLLRTPVA